jgi:hypothetical protein
MSTTMPESPAATVLEDGLASGVRIIFERRSPDSFERRCEPVTFGVPFPKGMLNHEHGLNLVAADGRSTPTQTRVLDRWSDGSIRWLLVDSQVSVGAGESEVHQLRQTNAPAGPQITTSHCGGAVTITTGAAEFRLRSGGCFPFESVTIDGQPVIAPNQSAITASDEAGECTVVISRVAVEEAGPLRVAAVAEGRITSPTHDWVLEVTLRMHFFVDSPVVRMLVCVRNPRRAEHPNGFWDLGDKGSVCLKDLSVTLALPASSKGAALSLSIARGAPFESMAEPTSVYQDSSGGAQWNSPNHINRHRKIPVSFRGYRLETQSGTRHGLRATPIVSLQGDAASLALTLPHFWQNFPKSVEARGRALIARLFPGQFADLHEIQGGEQKTHELFVTFGADRVTAQPLEWCRSRLVARADSSWYCSSGAIPYLTPLDSEADRARVELLNSAVSGPDNFEAKREAIDQYGWRHFGDIYGDHEAVRRPGLVSHYNNQYDPVLGFARQFLRSGDVRWWTQMQELAQHVVDIDVYHTVEDKWAYNHGLFWHTYHYGDADTASHRTYPRSARHETSGGGPSGEHNYTSGLTLHYFLTGDPTTRETVIDSGQYVIDSDDGSRTVFRWIDSGHTGFPTSSGLIGYQGPGRGSGNSLNALVDAFRLSNDRRFLDKAEQIIRRCIHPDDDVPAQDLLDAERKWFYTMFLQALGKYLDEKGERDELDAMYAYGRASLLHYARWMAMHERPTLDHPERVEFPTETWAAQDIRKSDVFYYASKHATDVEREQFRERGAFFFRYATETLHGMPSRVLARPVIVLLTSGTLHSWFATHVHPSANQPLAHASFGVRAPFTPQRVTAVRRAKLIGLAAISAAASALLYVACQG